MADKIEEILFFRMGIAYIPANLKGWIISYIYITIVGLIVILPSFIFDKKSIVSAYQLFAFLVFYVIGLRFAKRRSR